MEQPPVGSVAQVAMAVDCASGQTSAGPTHHSLEAGLEVEAAAPPALPQPLAFFAKQVPPVCDEEAPARDAHCAARAKHDATEMMEATHSQITGR